MAPSGIRLHEQQRKQHVRLKHKEGSNSPPLLDSIVYEQINKNLIQSNGTGVLVANYF
jgi:hypothetical protein